MLEGFILAVEVGKEVLRCLWQLHYGLKVYYLCRYFGDIGKFLCQQLQVPHIVA